MRAPFAPIRRGRRLLRTAEALRRPPTARFQAELDRLHEILLHRRGFGNPDPASNGEERALADIVTAAAEPEFVLFDVGANRGDFTERALPIVGARARIYCFEPSPVAFADLDRRFADDGRVVVQNVGLSDEEREAPLHGDSAGSRLGSLYARGIRGSRSAFGETERVRLRRLDTTCEELGVARIDYLKVDAEGHDLRVLHGCGAMLDGERVRAIQFEHGGTAMDARVFLRDFFDLLEPAYGIHRILPDGLWQIRPYREREEIAAYANYLALPAGNASA